MEIKDYPSLLKEITLSQLIQQYFYYKSLLYILLLVFIY